MKKFMDVDLIQSLKAVLQQNTGFYQSDFEIDRQILARAASEPEGRDKTFLWLSRPCGTHCLREREVFLKGSPAYGVWQFFGNRNHNGVLMRQRLRTMRGIKSWETCMNWILGSTAGMWRIKRFPWTM